MIANHEFAIININHEPVDSDETFRSECTIKRRNYFTEKFYHT